MAVSRRKFIRTTAGATTLASFASATPMFLVRSALAASSKPDDHNTVLVVLQLSGGNDGLNTVVPYADDAYGRNRPTLRLAGNELHKIDPLLGFHPQMAGFMRLYQEGHLSIVHGVGYPQMLQDHAAAMRVWHTANPLSPSSSPTGWLGRAADALWKPQGPDVPALMVGRIAPPFGLNAENAIIPSVSSPRELAVRGLSPDSDEIRCAQKAAEAGGVKSNNPNLDVLRQSVAKVVVNSQKIQSITSGSSTKNDYPSFQLAGDLHTVAQLIRADIGIRIYFTELGGVEIGGFDNHANQKGNHDALLHQLSESIFAFVEDLRRDNLLDRVLLMTFSEFGRTVQENGRHGTGHGSAAPLFLVGGRLKSPQVGAHPSLTDLENDGLKFHTDFRQVYATILDQWLGIESRKVLAESYQPIELFGAQ